MDERAQADAHKVDLVNFSTDAELVDSLRPDPAQVKNRVLASVVSRIEARDAKVELGTTLYGFAKFSKC